MTFEVRDAMEAIRARRLGDRPTRGPCPGLLEGIQRRALARNPEWAHRLRTVEDQPIATKTSGAFQRSGEPRRRRRA